MGFDEVVEIVQEVDRFECFIDLWYARAEVVVLSWNAKISRSSFESISNFCWHKLIVFLKQERNKARHDRCCERRPSTHFRDCKVVSCRVTGLSTA